MDFVRNTWDMRKTWKKKIRNLSRIVGKRGPIRLSMKVDISWAAVVVDRCNSWYFKYELITFLCISVVQMHCCCFFFLWNFHFNPSLLRNHHYCSFSQLRSKTFPSLFLSQENILFFFHFHTVEEVLLILRAMYVCISCRPYSTQDILYGDGEGEFVFRLNLSFMISRRFSA